MLADGSDGKRKVFGALLGENQVAIEGIMKCWCSSASFQGRLALINIVETVE